MNAHLITDYLIAGGMADKLANFVGIGAAITLILLLAYVSYWITKRYMVHVIEIVFQRSRNTWDDALVQHGFVSGSNAAHPGNDIRALQTARHGILRFCRRMDA